MDYDLDGYLEEAYEDRYPDPFTPDYEFEDYDGWYGPDPADEDEGEPFDPGDAGPSPDDVAGALARWQAELTASAEKIGEVLDNETP